MIVALAFFAACALDPRFRVRPLSEVQAESKLSGKGILVEYTAAWCEPCQVFEREILPRPEVQAALQDLVFVRFDVERSWGDDAYRRLLAVRRLPLFLVLDAVDAE